MLLVLSKDEYRCFTTRRLQRNLLTTASLIQTKAVTSIICRWTKLLAICRRAWLTVWLDRKKEQGALTCTLSKTRDRSETHYVARKHMRNFVAQHSCHLIFLAQQVQQPRVDNHFAARHDERVHITRLVDHHKLPLQTLRMALVHGGQNAGMETGNKQDWLKHYFGQSLRP